VWSRVVNQSMRIMGRNKWAETEAGTAWYKTLRCMSVSFFTGAFGGDHVPSTHHSSLRMPVYMFAQSRGKADMLSVDVQVEEAGDDRDGLAVYESSGSQRRLPFAASLGRTREGHDEEERQAKRMGLGGPSAAQRRGSTTMTCAKHHHGMACMTSSSQRAIRGRRQASRICLSRWWDYTCLSKRPTSVGYGGSRAENRKDERMTARSGCHERRKERKEVRAASPAFVAVGIDRIDL
jgi:hypothetical protein